MPNSLFTHGSAAVILVFALNWLKKTSWFPWVTQNSDKLNRAISVAWAILTTAGVSIQGSAVSGATITLPPLAILWSSALHAFTQFGGQELLYRFLKTHETTQEVLRQLENVQEQLGQLTGKGAQK